jgi:hypothetical protein
MNNGRDPTENSPTETKRRYPTRYDGAAPEKRSNQKTHGGMRVHFYDVRPVAKEKGTTAVRN